MHPHQVQEKVRELITETDQLSRHAHAARSDRDSAVFAALRSSLMRVERTLGATAPHPGLPGEIDLLYQRLRDAAARVREDQRAELGPLLASAEALHAQLPMRARPRPWGTLVARVRRSPAQTVAALAFLSAAVVVSVRAVRAMATA